MKMSKFTGTLFIIAAAAQLAVPASLIVRYERTLREGAAFKFKTAPVDPADAFRGRYVALGFEENQAPVAEGQKFETGQSVYVAVEPGPDGFAEFTALSHVPFKDKPYLKVRVQYIYGSHATLELPFDRFYLGEHVAPAAEQAYSRSNWRGRGQTNSPTYAQVRIRNGTGVIENLFISRKPIQQIIQEQTK